MRRKADGGERKVGKRGYFSFLMGTFGSKSSKSNLYFVAFCLDERQSPQNFLVEE